MKLICPICNGVGEHIAEVMINWVATPGQICTNCQKTAKQITITNKATNTTRKVYIKI